MSGKRILTSTRATVVLTRILLDRGYTIEGVREAAELPDLDPNLTDQAVELAGHVRLWHLAVRATGDPALGLRLFDYYAPEEMHFIGQVLKFAPDVRTSIVLWTRYVKLICPTDRVELRREGSFYVATYANLSPAHQNRFLPEHYASIGLMRGRLRTGRQLRPVEVRMTFPDPGYRDVYAEIFQAPAHFGCEENAMVFRLDDLEVPHKTADANLHKHLAEYADMLLAKSIAPESASDRAREALIRLLPRGISAKEEVAAYLDMGSRTLLRKLKDEGLTYRELLDETRKSLALAYLEEGVGITEIAYMLGFSEASALTNAFKAWFGQSPGKLRRELRDRTRV